jgi:hypothetical protein
LTGGVKVLGGLRGWRSCHGGGEEGNENLERKVTKLIELITMNLEK